MSYQEIKIECPVGAKLFMRNCQHEGCTKTISIGVFYDYCFEHSGEDKKYLKYPYRSPVLLLIDQERHY